MVRLRAVRIRDGVSGFVPALTRQCPLVWRNKLRYPCFVTRVRSARINPPFVDTNLHSVVLPSVAVDVLQFPVDVSRAMVV